MSARLQFEGQPRISAISECPGGDRLCIAGREVLKIVQYNSASNELTEHAHLRARTDKAVQRCNDCAWNAQNIDYIVTAATNGSLGLWNIHAKSKKLERVYNEAHNRAVNCVRWQPESMHIFISASQDGLVKQWDIRDPNPSVLTFSTRDKSAGVRSVQFSPHYPSSFVAALENGNIEVWDTAKPSEPFGSILLAHKNNIGTVAWHPEISNLLASGGRDGFIKVWDIRSFQPKPQVVIQTIDCVGIIAWRPGRTTQIASCASTGDNSIHLWDINKHYIPIASMEGHSDVITGFLWHLDSDHIVSCGKDSAVLRQSLRSKETKLPYMDVPSSSACWDSHGNLAAVSEPIDKDPTITTRSASVALKWSESQPSKRGLLNLVHDAEKTSRDSDIKISVFEYFAKHYVYSGVRPSEMCQLNSMVATSVKQHNIAQLWNLLKLSIGGPLMSVPECTVTGAATPLSRSKGISPSPTLHMSVSPNELNKTFSFPENDDYLELESYPDTSYDDSNLAIGLDIAFEPFRPLMAMPNEEETSLESSDGIRQVQQLPTFTEVQMDFTPSIIEAMKLHIDRGDIQTPVYMLLVFPKLAQHLDDLPERWFTAYISILQQKQMFSAAVEVANACDILSIQAPFKRSGITVGQPPGSLNLCALCAQPVKGLCMWSQACGHGGHLACLSSWYEQSEYCPSGCGHVVTVSKGRAT